MASTPIYRGMVPVGLRYNAHRTAIHRARMSAPAQALFNEGRIRGDVLDYGCGHGADVRALRDNHGPVFGYDPAWAPELPGRHARGYDTILCTFVLNVIPNAHMRCEILRDIGRLLKADGVAYVTVRRDVKRTGWTRSGTWQGNIALIVDGDFLAACISKRAAFDTYALSKADCMRYTPVAV
jgi:SAM-dependent methyltransferase